MFVKNKVDERKLKIICGLFIVGLLLQLKYSQKARGWAKNFGQMGLFLATAMGILGSVGSLVVKYKIEKDWDKIQ